MKRQQSIEAQDDPITVEVVRDGRLRTRVHWEWNGDHVRIRAPRRIPKRQLEELVTEIVEDVRRKRAQVRAQADADLEALARKINRRRSAGWATCAVAWEAAP